MHNARHPVCGRPAAADLAAVASLWADTFAVPEHQRARWLAPRRVRVVRVEGKVRGACTLSLLRLATPEGVRQCVWLRALAVAADARGQGLGGRLVHDVVVRARALGLPVALRSPLRDLYARAGLQPAGRMHGLELHWPPTTSPKSMTSPTLTTRPTLTTASPVREISLDPAQLEQLALHCTREHRGWVPLPNKTLRAALQHRALGLCAPDGTLLAACAVAREGVPWLAALDVGSGKQLLQSLARPSLRVDAYAPWDVSSSGITLRELGPWWCSEPSWGADLPASVLSCLD